jgi:hypothetical protein
MMDIANLMGTMSRYLDTQRELAQCRAVATGDADYYSYSYRLAAEQAEQALANALNSYIDQRMAEAVQPLEGRSG